ncbi:MAG: flagellar hook-associated protein FlgK [Cyanobacteria bacterium P01_H01_bin.74]
MITPGFFGLFNAQRGLLAAQNAMNTINHNIANANTEGYSRQRVELSAYNPYTFPTSLQENPVQIGQGVEVDAVIRIRDVFLDTQFRNTNGDLGQSQTMQDVLQSIEGILNEPSTSSINNSLQSFFDAAQDLSLQPDSTAARSNYIQQAIDVVNIFRDQALQLDELRRNLVGDPLVAGSIDTSQAAIYIRDINTTLDAIESVNQSITSVKSSGAEPNDLFDQRDRLIDDLSELVDVEVTNLENGQVNLVIAGKTVMRGGVKVDEFVVATNTGTTPSPDDMPILISNTTPPISTLNDGGLGFEITGGRLKGVIDMAGNDPNLSTIRGVLGDLDTLIGSVVNEVNTLQAAGRDQNGTLNPGAIFINNPALNPGKTLNIFHWEVNTAVTTDPSLIATAIDDATIPGGFAGVGDGRNALSVGQLRNQSLVALGGASTVEYLNALVSKVGIDTRSYENINATNQSQNNTVINQRESVSGVNIDEETIDLLRYQRAFEATSRTIAVLDEVMQTIINLA